MVVVGCQMLFQLLCGSSYYHSADWSSPTVELEEQVSEVGREVAADQPAREWFVALHDGAVVPRLPLVTIGREHSESEFLLEEAPELVRRLLV